MAYAAIFTHFECKARSYYVLNSLNTKSCKNISLDLGKDIPLNKLFFKLLTI